MQLRACHYDDNTDMLTVIDTVRSYLRWMKEKEPYTFAELVLQGDVKQFAKRYSREYLKQQTDLEKQLTIHFQDKSYAQAIAGEMMVHRD